MRRYLALAASVFLLCPLVIIHVASASASGNPGTTARNINIQMLPPTGCPKKGEAWGILAWDGISTLGCIAGLTSDAQGNLSANSVSATSVTAPTINATAKLTTPSIAVPNGSTSSLNINSPTDFGSNLVAFGGGVTFSAGTTSFTGGTTDFTTTPNFQNGLTVGGAGNAALTADGVAVADNLASMAPCSSGQALSITGRNSVTGANTFSCVNVVDINGVGEVSVPTCSSGNQLYFTGAAFTCAALPTIQGPEGPQGPAATSSPSGTLCGHYEVDNSSGSPLEIPGWVLCLGYNPFYGCPPGYTQNAPAGSCVAN